MGPTVLVAKRGEYGAGLFTGDGFFGLPGMPLEDVRDPTGAGDSFAGGFLGYLDSRGDDLSPACIRRAMAYGTVIASFNVEEFGTERVAALDAGRGRGAARGAAGDDPLLRRVAARIPGGERTKEQRERARDPAGRRRDRGRGCHRHPLGHRQPDRRELRDRDHRRDREGDGLPPDQGLRGRLRADDLRPGVHQHGVVPLGDHLHRRREGHPPAPRDPDRAALRAVDLPRGRLPPDLRRAAHPGAARALALRRHPPHVRPRERQAVRRGVPLRRPPDGDAARRRRRALDLLPAREGHRRPRGALHGGDPPAGEDADARGVLLPPQPRPPLRLSGQRPELPRELPLDDVQDDRGQVRPGSAPREGARRPLHPPRRPRAELLDERGPLGRAPRRSIPTRPSRPASRRSTARFTAAPTRRSCGCSAGSRAPRTSPTSSRA